MVKPEFKMRDAGDWLIHNRNRKFGDMAIIPSRRKRKPRLQDDDKFVRALCNKFGCNWKCNTDCSYHNLTLNYYNRLRDSEYKDDHFRFLRLIKRATERLIEGAEGEEREAFERDLADIEAQIPKPF